jgi:putative membrane protein insertion efficiency factor
MTSDAGIAMSSVTASDPSPTSRAQERAPSAGARITLVLLRVYQGARSGRVSPCRFTPTCSQYAAEAVHRHGARRGLRLTIGRLGRCRPGGPFGLDPVPE